MEEETERLLMEDNFDIRLGNTLREVREAKNKTQVQIAELMNVSKMTVSHWEKGDRAMTARRLLEYCRALEVSAQVILDKAEEEERRKECQQKKQKMEHGT